MRSVIFGLVICIIRGIKWKESPKAKVNAAMPATIRAELFAELIISMRPIIIAIPR